MKEKRLLYAIGWIDDRYIVEMQERPVRAHTKIKLWLIAAIITTILLLAGCAAAFFWMQQLSIGTNIYTKRYDPYGHIIEPTEKARNVISFSSLANTPKRQAAKDLYDFLTSYDPQRLLMPDEEDQTIPENLRYTYGCYNWEMADKVIEIAKNYNLKLLDTPCTAQSYAYREVLNAVGLDSLTTESVMAEYGSASVSPPYNFDIHMEIVLVSPDAHWPYRAIADFSYFRNDYLSGGYSIPIEVDQYQQWSHTTPDGTKLLMALNETLGEGFIVSAQEEANIVIHLAAAYGANIPRIEGASFPRSFDRIGFEELADSFVYSIQPQEADGTALLEKLNEQDAVWTAELQAQAESHPSYFDFSAYLKENTDLTGSLYAFLDLDADGTAEMLLGDGTGSIHTYLTIKDGVVRSYSPPQVGACLLENGGLMYGGHEPTEFNSNFTYLYYRPISPEQVLEFLDDQVNTHTGGYEIGVSRKEGRWYTCDLSSFPQKLTPITEAEALRIIESHPRLALNWSSLNQYLLDETEKTYGQWCSEQDHALSETEQLALYQEEAARLQTQYQCDYYALLDLNQDGRRELLLSRDGTALFAIYTIKCGRLQLLSQQNLLYLCEGGIIEEIRSYQKTNRNHPELKEQELYHSWLRFDGTNRQTLGFLYENVTNGTWSDNMDLHAIGEEDARTIQSLFPRSPIQMEQIQNFLTASIP